MNTDDITLTGKSKSQHARDEFLVVHIRRSGGYFSVTADEYASEKAFKLGNENAVIGCGALHDTVLATFPELAPIVRLHLADVATGEPMHARSNGWYYFSGRAAAAEFDHRAKYNGSKNHYDSPDDVYGADWIPYWREKAARALNCSVADLPDTEDREIFDEWVDEVMVPRWQQAADDANAYIDAHKTSILIPADQDDEEEFEVELDEGLKVSAKLSDSVDSEILPGRVVYQYDVVVSIDSYIYDAKFFGSVNDYENGVVNAREAAFGTLRELMSFVYESAQSLADEWFKEGWDGIDKKQRDGMLKCERAAEAMSQQLEANMDVIGV